jgi:hypothetical protein
MMIVFQVFRLAALFLIAMAIFRVSNLLEFALRYEGAIR